MKRSIVILVLLGLSTTAGSEQAFGQCDPQVLLPPSASHSDFGHAVCVSAQYLFMGDPSYPCGSGPGRVSIYKQSSLGLWQHGGDLASNGPPLSQFGSAIASDGVRLAVGSPGGNASVQGSVHVFVRLGDTWIFEQAIVAPSVEKFGRAVALAGNHLVVGALNAAHAYRRTSAGWTSQGPLNPILPPFTFEVDFGRAVSIAGSRLAVSDPKGQDYPYVCTFNLIGDVWVPESSLWAPELYWWWSSLGDSLSLDGERLAVGDTLAQSVRVYEQVANEWQEEPLTFNATPAAGAKRGAAVALEGDKLLVGAPGGAGQMHLLYRVGDSWYERELWQNLAGAFGAGVAISESRAVVTAPDSLGTSGCVGVAGGAFSRDVQNDQTLFGCPNIVSGSAGGTQVLIAEAGTQQVLQLYLLLGSGSGTSPGLPTAVGTLPLNFDSYTLFTLNNPNSSVLVGSLGFTDPTGHAKSSIVVPSGLGQLAGLTLEHAFLTVDLTTAGAPVTLVSNAVKLRIAP